jgi:hypothetical protein
LAADFNVLISGKIDSIGSSDHLVQHCGSGVFQLQSTDNIALAKEVPALCGFGSRKNSGHRVVRNRRGFTEYSELLHTISIFFD